MEGNGQQKKRLRRRWVRVTKDQLARRQFERWVVEAIASLPKEIRASMENVDVVVEDRPSAEILAEAGLPPGDTLYGYYQGVPHHQRGAWYGMALPDKISIYREPIMSDCRTSGQVKLLVRSTVWHEVAHHFGIDDEALRNLGLD